VAELLREGDRVTGARLRDERSAAQGEVRASVIINATGPWCDTVRQLEAPAAAPVLRLTKGVHVVVPQARVGNQHAIIFTSPLDGRVMFILPWNEWTYIGTTDTDSAAAPDAVTADETDLVYLLRSANAMFPGAHLGPEDVVSSWAGLRPLLAADPSAAASLLSREHRILRGPLGMLTLAGGKLTTFRPMAAEGVDRAMEALGLTPHAGEPRSKREPLPGGEAVVSLEMRRACRALGLSSETVQYLVGQYGRELDALHRLCREHPELRNPLHPEHPAIAAQVVFGIEQEFACTAADILERRTRLALETRDHGEAARPAVERILLERGGLS
jgi:glycerol-3-phosphate dehydrogenase